MGLKPQFQRPDGQLAILFNVTSPVPASDEEQVEGVIDDAVLSMDNSRIDATRV